jgi:hypothetical protein
MKRIVSVRYNSNSTSATREEQTVSRGHRKQASQATNAQEKRALADHRCPHS